MNQNEWERLLGKDTFQSMDETKIWQLDKALKEQEKTHLAELHQIFEETTVRTEWGGEHGLFDTFFQWFFSVALCYAKRWAPVLFTVCENGKADVLHNVYAAVQMIPLRCLIEEIHRCRDEGRLSGDTPQEEYCFYETQMLQDKAYVTGFCRVYPEVLRLMLLKIAWTVRELEQIAVAAEHDRMEIQTVFCPTQHFIKIRTIRCACSDTHRGGKTVAEVLLDNGLSLFYKPRSMQKECVYQRIYDWFGQQLGMKVPGLKRTAGADYGWEEKLVCAECGSVAAVERYFYRLGIQLFLCWLGNISDLHGENVMANGEFPVIVDMEACAAGDRDRKPLAEEGDVESSTDGGDVEPSTGGGDVEPSTGDGEGKSSEEIVQDFLRESVLWTGILPMPVWGGGRAGQVGQRQIAREQLAGAGGVNVSALHRGGIVRAPFRLPVIEHAGTSDIAVSYRQGEWSLSDSLPRLNQTAVDPAKYKVQLMKGFADAYHFAEKHKKEMETMFAPLWESESRYVLRHTQQYSMYMFTSLHPDFMKDSADRIRFLHVLRKSAQGQEVFRQELRQMLDLDIPYFSVKGDTTALLAPDGAEIPHFLAAPLANAGRRKCSRLCESDLLRQQNVIAYSLLMLGENSKTSTGHFPRMHGSKKVQLGQISEKGREGAKQNRVTGAQKRAAVVQIVKKICRMSLNREEQSVWMDIRFGTDGAWAIRPLSMDLYDGLPGLAVFFAALSETIPDEEYEQWFERLWRQMAAYTDNGGAQAGQNIQGRDTSGQNIEERDMAGQSEEGLFVGDSSVCYTWLLLWERKKKPEFLEYAKKQERMLHVRRQENEVDLLSGDAGLILCYLKLYESSAEEPYLQTAIEIGESLWMRARAQEKGCGFIIRGEEKPLAGMAHGNSGIICAYAGLLKQTHNPVYAERIRSLMEYEETLYSDTLQNWKDVRIQRAEHTEKRNLVAWCHGAAGILLSRFALSALPEFRSDVQVQRDIRRAASALIELDSPDTLCFCHGLAGNYWIIRQYLNSGMGAQVSADTDRKLEAKAERMLKRLLELLNEDESAAAQERSRVGMMCGLAGAGLVLCEL